MTTVMGIDGAASGWLGVVLVDGVYARSDLRHTLRGLLWLAPEALVIAIDIPIGLPTGRFRPADKAARQFVGSRLAASVFETPPEEVLRAASHAEAVAIAMRLLGQGISVQSYALRKRIFEVAEVAAADPRIVEVHPEVSFRALADAPLVYAKSAWNGLIERLNLLVGAGIHLPMEMDGGSQSEPDDVVDAAIAAWSARRVHEGRSATLPAIPATDPAMGGVIYY